jgi:hypothetical protein
MRVLPDLPPGDAGRAGLTAAVVVSGCYMAAQILSDVASLRIVSLAGLEFDAGTLVYPFTFTLRDLVHKTAGKRAARSLIAAAAFVNLFMAGLFWLVAGMPAAAGAGPQAEFGLVLSPVWRIVAASIAAEVLSELLDTEVYSHLVRRRGQRLQWAGVLASNAAAIPVDSLAFCWLAFGGVLPSGTVWAVVGANVVLKTAATLLGMPLIYAVRAGAARDQ